MKTALRLFALILPSVACGQAAAVVADTYTDRAAPAGNFGARETLLVGPSHRTLLLFTLPPAPANASLGRAVLTLYVSRVATPGAVEVSTARARLNRP
jgi:hypothetical protein